MIVGLFLWFQLSERRSRAKAEDGRVEREALREIDRAKVMDIRHERYFSKLDTLGEGCHEVQEKATSASQANTRVLGEVAETNRGVMHALKKQ